MGAKFGVYVERTYISALTKFQPFQIIRWGDVSPNSQLCMHVRI